MRHLSPSLASLLVLAAFSCKSAEPAGEPSPIPARTTPDGTPRAEEGAEAEEEGELAASAEATAPAGQEDEETSALAARFIEFGDQLRDRGDLQGALERYAQALEFDPDDPTARARLRDVQERMGDRYARATQFMEDAARRETVRRAQARLAAEQEKLAGENAMRRGDHEAAVRHFQTALVILGHNPFVAGGSLDEELIRQRLESAQTALDEERRRDEEAVAAEAARERAELEEQQRTLRASRLQRLYAEAYSAFSSERYRRAEDLAQQILLSDPGNEHALEMRELAQVARHQKTNAENARNLREQWLRTFEDLGTMALPQTDSIVFDDLRRWREVRQRSPIEFGGTDAGISAENAAIHEALENTQIEAVFGGDGEGAPLEEVAAFLQQVTGVNFLISARVRDELDEEETAVELELPRRSVRKILDLIAETSESLRWKVQDGVVKFVTIDELTGGQVLAMYEARDLIHPVPDFPGRDINISPSGGIEPIDEDIEERDALVLTADALDALIRDNVAPESWDADPANSLRITESGTLVVNQTPEVQDQIRQLLEDLREATGIMVDIQARFLTVEDNFLEDIGVDFRGLGSPGLGTNSFFNDFGEPSTQQDLGQEIGTGTDAGAFYDDGEDGEAQARVENLYDTTLGDENILTASGGLSLQWTYLNDLQFEMILRAVQKSERVELVTAPNILVFNTARSNLTVLNQVAYVQDYDVEIAQSASIADPIIDVIEDGVILDVRPVVSADRRFITLELRPTVAELQRPIPEISTSLGTGGEVTIQLPEVEISRVRTSVPMPDGGTVLLGGLKIHEKRELRSGVPILNKIPILSLLFDRKGIYQTNRKLLILLKAKIVIPAEHEPSAAQLGTLTVAR